MARILLIGESVPAIASFFTEDMDIIRQTDIFQMEYRH